jgi:hypothetical protein
MEAACMMKQAGRTRRVGLSHHHMWSPLPQLCNSSSREEEEEEEEHHLHFLFSCHLVRDPLPVADNRASVSYCMALITLRLCRSHTSFLLSFYLQTQLSTLHSPQHLQISINFNKFQFKND